MEVYETMVLSLRFEDQDKGDTKQEKQKHITKCFLDITTFKDGRPTVESVDLKKELISERKSGVSDELIHVLSQSTEAEIPHLYYYVSLTPNLTMNDLTMILAPHIARMGTQGWELMDFKVSSDNYQAQALLKRKVNKE